MTLTEPAPTTEQAGRRLATLAFGERWADAVPDPGGPTRR